MARRAVIIPVLIAFVIAALAIVYLMPKGGGVTPSKPSRILITIGGSSFQAPQQNIWINEFRRLYPNITVTYSSVGSGAGIAGFLEGVYDIGATDVPMPTSLYEKAVEKYGSVLTIPVLLGGIAVIYNLPGVDKPLNLTADILAKIYCGEIKYWDDEELKKLNPSVKLPHKRIIAVHRSDASGTTYVFTMWLYKSSETWRKCVGRYNFTISWPVDRIGQGRGGKGNEGVATTVKDVPYSIGYVELQYAYVANLTTALIQNPSTGEFVPPTPETVLNAVSALNTSVLPGIAEDWFGKAFVFLNVKAPNAYPIVSATYLHLRGYYDDCLKAIAIYKYVSFIVTKGQEMVARGYVPLPKSLRNKIVEELGIYLKCKGKPVVELIHVG